MDPSLHIHFDASAAEGCVALTDLGSVCGVNHSLKAGYRSHDALCSCYRLILTLLRASNFRDNTSYFVNLLNCNAVWQPEMGLLEKVSRKFIYSARTPGSRTKLSRLKVSTKSSAYARSVAGAHCGVEFAP